MRQCLDCGVWQAWQWSHEGSLMVTGCAVTILLCDWMRAGHVAEYCFLIGQCRVSTWSRPETLVWPCQQCHKTQNIFRQHSIMSARREESLRYNVRPEAQSRGAGKMPFTQKTTNKWAYLHNFWTFLSLIWLWTFNIETIFMDCEMFCTGCKDGIRWRCLETFESQDCLWSVFWDGEKSWNVSRHQTITFLRPWTLSWTLSRRMSPTVPWPDSWHELQTLFYERVIIQECGAIVLIIWSTRKYFEVLIRKIFWCEQKAYCHQG